MMLSIIIKIFSLIHKMKVISFFFLILIIPFSFARKNERLDQNIVDKIDDDFDIQRKESEESFMEFQPEAEREEKRTMKGCKKNGEYCNGDDCNCCDSESWCHCFLWIKADWNCRCTSGSSSENYGTCLLKQKECDSRIYCRKPSRGKKGNKMKVICFLLISVIAFSSAKENENSEQNNVDAEDSDLSRGESEDSFLEIKLETERAKKKSMKGCKEVGEDCNGEDCNCCSKNSWCKCFLGIKVDGNCKCSTGSSSENYDTCLKKQGECAAEISCSEPGRCTGGYPRCRLPKNGK